MEAFLFYSSLTLVATGCLALSLSILFHLRSRVLNNLPRNLSATVFSRTFTVFDPYPQQTKVVHSLMLALPFVAFFVTVGLTLVVWEILASGLILSVLTLVISLNLIVIEEAPEVYTNSSTFIKAIRSGTSLATGDLKALRLIKNLAAKLSKYYLGLAIFLVTSSVALPYIWIAVPWLFSQLIDLITRSSSPNQIAILPIAVILTALSLLILQLLAFKIKNRIFRHDTTWNQPETEASIMSSTNPLYEETPT